MGFDLRNERILVIQIFFDEKVVVAILRSGRIRVYYRMQKILEVRFASDNLFKEEEKLIPYESSVRS